MFSQAITLMVRARECLCNCQRAGWERPLGIQTVHRAKEKPLSPGRGMTADLQNHMCYYRHQTHPCSLCLLNVSLWFVQDPMSQMYFKSIAWGSKGSSVKFPVFPPPQFICYFQFPNSILVCESRDNPHLLRQEKNMDAVFPMYSSELYKTWSHQGKKWATSFSCPY